MTIAPLRLFPTGHRPRAVGRLATLVLASATLLANAQTPPPAPIQVPAGFEVVRVAAPPLVGFPMLGGFDDRGRLFVAENAGVNLNETALAAQPPSHVRMLEDTDGDGIFDRSTIFADKLTFPQGVQWLDGALYVASPPSIWRFEDTDGDGRADTRREIATGFKFTGNAADVHGPFLHPNGRLYWCHGRKGHEVFQSDGTLVSKGVGARIWSSRADGTDIQVHAGGGMDNPTEITFDQEGNIFGTVNLFLANPRADAVVHWIYGGVYPRFDQERIIAEFKRTGDLLAPITSLGHVAPAGTTLVKNESWAPDYRGNLFLAEFNTRRIMRVAFERDGATFHGRPEIFATSTDSGVHFTDVIEDADGSLLVIDTGAWFRSGCPTSGVARPDILGGIYRIRRTGAKSPVDPRGLAIRWTQLSPEKLIEHLADPRPVVRERSVAELAKKSDAVSALATALGDPRYLVRSNAVWTLTRIGTTAAKIAARRALADADARVREAAAQSVFATNDQDAFPSLARLLADESPAVKREAARALGRLRNPAAISVLATAIAATESSPVLTHALIFALIEIAQPADTQKLLDHQNARVRRAGLIALDQMFGGNLVAGSVFDALKSSDAGLRSAALQIAAKRTAWSREAADHLSYAFAEAGDAGRVETGARILSAFIASADVRAWLKAHITSRPAASALTPRAVLDAIASAAGAWDDSWREPLLSAFRSTDLTLAQAALRAIAIHRDRDFSAALREVAGDPARPTAFRVASLQTAAGGDKLLDAESFQMLMEPFVTGGSPEGRQQAASVLSGAKLSREHLLSLAARLPAAGPVELPQLLGAFQRGPADAEIAAALLAQLQATPARWSLVGGDLQTLFRRFPPPASENAAPMISEILNQAVAKESRVTELEKIASGGDPARGKAAFLAGAGACVSCHRVGDIGAKIGPDLSHIGRIRETRDLLEAIAFPSATLARGYETFSIQTKLGETLVGTIPRETAGELIVATGDGREIPVARTAIVKMESITTSLMPAGLDRALDPKTLADLVAFLKSLQ
ncbi:MAG: HEAT repeat domain-containing protein [Opitutaceae bacterium]|nr:HEAT repeat domain-containing protein [Opitutaceae bacterium]